MEYAVSRSDQLILLLSNVCFLGHPGSFKVKFTLPPFQHSKGEEVFYLSPSDKQNLCPVDYLIEYLKVHLDVRGSLFIRQSGTPVSRTVVSYVLRTAICKLGLDPLDYPLHSLRIGRATDLSREKAPEHVIKKTG